jgi:hypothetical protein
MARCWLGRKPLSWNISPGRGLGYDWQRVSCHGMRTQLVNLPVNIIERESQEFVEGIVRLARQGDKVLWSRWHSAIYKDSEDGHWAWDEFIDQAFADPEQFVVYALEARGELQGLRMIQVAKDEVEEYGIHALRLSTAPWNREPAIRYRGVGSLLVAAAILRSQADNRAGHLHCESLPEAEEFHRRNGMVAFDGLSDGLSRYRFTRETAERFLTRLRSKGLLPWPT